jgi:hypothetical protein
MDEKIVVSKEETDSIVFSIVNQFLERAKFGKIKYGTDMDRTDLSLIDWVTHAIEESLDKTLYLEKIKQMLLKEEDKNTK